MQLSSNTTEYILEALIREKQFSLLDQLWMKCSPSEQEKWGIASLYMRGQLANHQKETVTLMLKRMEREGFTIPVANSNLLIGREQW